MVFTESVQLLEALEELVFKVIYMLTSTPETFELVLDIINGLGRMVEWLAEKPEVLNSLLLLIKQLIELALTVAT